MSKIVISVPRFRRRPWRRFVNPLLPLSVIALLTAMLTLELPGMPIAAYAQDETPVRIWSADDIPPTQSSSDGQAVVLGTQFRPTDPISVKGVRFYKGAGNSGNHVGYLWTGSGQILASVAFGRETESGWQSALFSQPVDLAANRTYVVGYLAPRGRYAIEEDAFAGGPITSHSIRGIAGVFDYGLDFPQSSWRSSAYFVDVVAAASVTPEPSPTPTPSSTPQPSPSATPTASATLRGCAVHPSACGYPDASNTGVSDESSLRNVPIDIQSGQGWHVSGRSIVVDTVGAVLQDIETDLTIEVTANNVTVRNVRSHVSGETWGVGVRHAEGVTIRDSQFISAPGKPRLLVGIKDIYGDTSDITIERVEISGSSTGIQVHGGVVRNCYIHDMGYREGDHTNGLTTNGATTPLTIHHNTILVRQDQTDAIGLFQDFGLEANRTITDNLLAGGGYTVYGGDGRFGRTYNIVFSGNRFSRIYYPNSGSYGPVAHFESWVTANRWVGNIWDDTLQAVN